MTIVYLTIGALAVLLLCGLAAEWGRRRGIVQQDQAVQFRTELDRLAEELKAPDQPANLPVAEPPVLVALAPGTPVRIVPLERMPGTVEKVAHGRGGIEYSVRYWMDGSIHFEWVREGEVVVQ